MALINHSAKSLAAASVLSRILSLMYHRAAAENIAPIVQGFMQKTSGIVLTPAAPPTPQYLFAFSGYHRLLCFSGVPNTVTALRLVRGYQATPNTTIGVSINEVLEEAATNLIPFLNANLSGHNGCDITIAGHSFGGAMASIIAPYVKSRNPLARVKTVTFGSPRSVNLGNFVPVPPTLDYCRFMCEGDPVPILPPHWGEDVEGYLLMSARTRINMNNWLHIGQGQILSQEGTVTPADTTAGTLNNAGRQLVGWATAVLSNPVLEHAIATYEARLLGYYPANFEALPVDNVVNDRPRLEPAALPPANEVPAPTVDPRPNPIIQAAGIAGYDPRPPKPFYHAKVNGVWCVYHYQDYLVSCKGRREAVKIARDYNQVAAQWLTARDGDFDAIQTAIEFEIGAV